MVIGFIFSIKEGSLAVIRFLRSTSHPLRSLRAEEELRDE